MKLILPPEVEVMHAPMVAQRNEQLVVTGMLGFDLADPENFCQSQDIWRAVESALEEGDALDSWMPKMRGEVLVWGRAMSPELVTQCLVSVECGKISKSLHVEGDKHWELGPWGWRPSAPAQFVEMPVHWKRAFGGDEFAQCPIGIGFNAEEKLARNQRAVLPNISACGEKLRQPSDTIKSDSFMPKSVAWRGVQPSGTFDSNWLARDYPALPDDFGWELFNQAPSDQQIAGFWGGGEQVRLKGFHSALPVIDSRLPGAYLRCFGLRRGCSIIEEWPMQLDTVCLFPNQMRGLLLFRSVLGQAGLDGRSIDAMMLAADWIGEPRPLDYFHDAFRQCIGASELATKELLMPPARRPVARADPARSTAFMATAAAPVSAVAFAAISPLTPELKGALSRSGLPVSLPPGITPKNADEERPAQGFTAAHDDLNPPLFGNMFHNMVGEIEELIQKIKGTPAQTKAIVIDWLKGRADGDPAREIVAELSQVDLATMLPGDGAAIEFVDLLAALEPMLGELRRAATGIAEHMQRDDLEARGELLASDLNNLFSETQEKVAQGQKPGETSLKTLLSGENAPLKKVANLLVNYGEQTGLTTAMPPEFDGLLDELVNSNTADMFNSAATQQVLKDMPLELFGRAGIAQALSNVTGDKAEIDPLQAMAKFVGLKEDAMPASFSEIPKQLRNQMQSPKMEQALGELSKMMTEQSADNLALDQEVMSMMASLKSGTFDLSSLLSIAPEKDAALSKDENEDVQVEEETMNSLHGDAKKDASGLLSGAVVAEAIRKIDAQTREARRHARGRPALAATINDSEAKKLGNLFRERHANRLPFSDLDFAGADLRGADLRGIDLRGAFLEQADFRGADLRSAQGAGAVLIGANLENALLSQVDFSAANLSGVQAASSDWTGASLRDAIIAEADFSNAKMQGVDFGQCDGVGVKFLGANLALSQARKPAFRQADFTGACARQACWDKPDLMEAKLERLDASGAQFAGAMLIGAHGAHARFDGGCLTDANAINAKLEALFAERVNAAGSSWHASQLAGSNFAGAVLGDSNFNEANLSGSRFNRASMKDVLASNADLTSCDFSEAQLLGAQLRGAHAAYADFTGANLYQADLAGANLRRCDFSGALLDGTLLNKPSNDRA